jgi:hypothetical protein
MPTLFGGAEARDVPFDPLGISLSGHRFHSSNQAVHRFSVRGYHPCRVGRGSEANCDKLASRYGHEASTTSR